MRNWINLIESEIEIESEIVESEEINEVFGLSRSERAIKYIKNWLNQGGKPIAFTPAGWPQPLYAKVAGGDISSSFHPFVVVYLYEAKGIAGLSYAVATDRNTGDGLSGTLAAGSTREFQMINMDKFTPESFAQLVSQMTEKAQAKAKAATVQAGY